MTRSISSQLIRLLLVVSLLTPPLVPADTAQRTDVKEDHALLDILKAELERANTELAKTDPAPYFISYSVYDQDGFAIVGSNGGILTSVPLRRRFADVKLRVGSPALDNTHSEGRMSGIVSGALPLVNDGDAVSRVLWQLTNQVYRRAAPTFLRVKTTTAVRSEEEDKSPDFSEETPQQRVGKAPAPLKVDQKAWEERVRRYSGLLRKYAEVQNSQVTLQVQRTEFHFVSSEGSTIVTPGTMARLVIQAETIADDGMPLFRVESFQAARPEQLPAEKEIEAKISRMAEDLKALRAAPLAEPFAGPALLSGRAAAVFFHEVLGHRLEGHRQRSEQEGQTFTKKLGQPVLPEFLSVVDDPTQRQLNGLDLSGAYEFDDEGIPARRVEVIQNGVLRSFLMSRMPVQNFMKSNGHGRAQPGLMPTGRQGNLIVSSSKTVKNSELRTKFIEEIKRAGKPYGLYFEDVQGGFTLTTRFTPQAFQVFPVMVWRVYADGRPDELVRGVDIVGTPLVTLNRILLTGDTPQVFNGICGAESGSVPVSAAAPAMLFGEMEVQKRPHPRNRPPILTPPGIETASPVPVTKTPAGAPR